MGIASHLRGNDHKDDPDVRFQKGEHKGKIKKKGLERKRKKMLFVEPQSVNEPSKTHEEKALCKTTGVS